MGFSFKKFITKQAGPLLGFALGGVPGAAIGALGNKRIKNALGLDNAPNSTARFGGEVFNPTLGRTLNTPDVPNFGFTNLGDAQLNPLIETFQQARGLFNGGNKREFFGGQTFADLNKTQTDANSQIKNQVGSAVQGLAPQLNDALQFGLKGVLDPASNPATQATIAAAQRPTTEAFQRGLQSITAQASQAGGVGGSRQGVLEANLAKDFGRTLADQAAGIQNNAFNRGLDTFGRTLALAPQTANVPFNLLARQQQVGAQEQNQEQNAIDEQVARFNFNQEAPFRELSQLQQFITAPGTFGPTPAQPKKNRLGGVLGGAASGAGIGGSVGGPIGAGVGGVIGAGLGLFS